MILSEFSQITHMKKIIGTLLLMTQKPTMVRLGNRLKTIYYNRYMININRKKYIQYYIQ